MAEVGLFAFMGAFGGFWTALLFLAVVVGGCVASEYENFFLGAITLLLILVALSWFGGIPVWAAFSANPLLAILALVVYGAVGAAYTGFWRFPNYLRKHEYAIMETYRRWRTDNKIEESDAAFDQYLMSDSYRYKAKDNKSRLGNWVLMWPFALAWELSHKPFIAVYNYIYYSMGDLFDEIGRRTARRVYKNGKK